MIDKSDRLHYQSKGPSAGTILEIQEGTSKPDSSRKSPLPYSTPISSNSLSDSMNIHMQAEARGIDLKRLLSRGRM